MTVFRRVVLFLATPVLGGAVLGSLAAAVDWRRILLNGDFVEQVYLHRLWFTVTTAGALAGLVLGLLCLPILLAVARRRGRPQPGGFRLPFILTAALLLTYLILRIATPIYEGRLPRLRIDRACGSTGNVRQDGVPPASVILVVLDTVRADHLSLHGYHRPTTPELERLAGESLVCDSARSTSSWTLPAHGSLFTGLYPSQHRLHSYHPDNRAKGQPLLAAYPLARRLVTMPALLRRTGYQTAAIYANPILSPRFRLDRGFDLYHCPQNLNTRLPLLTGVLLESAPRSHWFAAFRKSTPSARQVNRRVLHWLDHHARPPFFLFVNFMDAHWPYQPPPPFDTRFPGRADRTPEQHELRNTILGRQREMSKAERNSLLSQYDGEISYLDSQLGELFRHLRERGIFDSSLIIVTSDHGEYFGEHQLVFHGRELYEAGVKIPLLVKYPHGEPRGRLVEPVGLEDVFPTIFDHLGLPLPGQLSGVPLGAERNGPTVSENYYSFKFDLQNENYGSRFERVRRAMILGRHKFIHSSDGRHELYDLRDDPDETANLLAVNPGLADPFLAQARALELAAARPRAREDLAVPRAARPDEEEKIRDMLVELGYLEAEAP